MNADQIPAAGNSSQSVDTKSGFLFALGAYGLWAGLSLYIKALDHINPLEVLANRALWSVPVAAVILWWLGRTKDIIPTFKSPKRLMLLTISASVVSFNWGVFVWAIMANRAIEAALGYYINPLITVTLGVLFLGDRFNKPQLFAVMLATAAVLLLTIADGNFPWVSLSLAISFALYGFIRKTIDVGPTQGFWLK